MDVSPSFLNRLLMLQTGVTIVTVVVALLTIVGRVSAADGPSRDAAPKLNGTFLQLSDAHANWNRDQWHALFDCFKQLSLSRLVVQFSADDSGAYYPQSSTPNRRGAVIPTILEMADETGIAVFIGLAHDTMFWRRIARDPALVEVYLRRVEVRSAEIVRALTPLARDHHSFAGWYITEEIDDVNWVNQGARVALFGHLGALSRGLHEATPGLPVAISGFSNGNLDPETFAKFWLNLVDQTKIDAVFFQDGVGARKLEINEVPLYVEPLKQALAGHVQELQVIVELFRQIDGAPFNDRPFAAVPASFDRVAQQLAVAARFSSSPLAFTIPDYMSPLAGPEATALFDQFRRASQR
jgi:hypothetical protein